MALQALSFRNLEPIDLYTDCSFVIFHGANGQGKTNLLEAIYLLSTLKPLRAKRTQELIRFGEKAAVVVGRVQRSDFEQRYKVALTPEGRIAEIDGKRASMDQWFEGVRAIAFTPTDAEIVLGGPSERRAWLDRAAFTKAPVHLDIVRRTQRSIDQKAAALRSGRADDDVLDALDEDLAVHAARLVERRSELLEELRPWVGQMYRKIAGAGSQRVDLRYRSAGGDSSDGLVDRWRSVLRKSRAGERSRRMCLAGPQRDDVEILLDGQIARSFGSRGQIRSIVLALKLAELVAARDRGDAPMFILDDLSSELDRKRTDRLVGILGDLASQVFISTTDVDHLGALPRSATLHVAVREGNVEEQRQAEGRRQG